MRIEEAAMRSWLLAGFAGAGAVLCGLAAFGLGGHIGSAEGESQAAAIPTLTAELQQPAAVTAVPSEVAARPVFAKDRLPHPFFLDNADGQPASGGLRLTGVLITPGLQMATLSGEQGQSLRLRLHGEAVQGWRLLELQPRSATLEGPGGTRSLELQVYNGGIEPSPDAAGNADHHAASSSNSSSAAPAVATSATVTPPAAANAGSGAAPAPKKVEVPRLTEQARQSLRERIQARRRQMRESQTGTASGNKP